MSIFSDERVEVIAERIYKELIKKGLIKPDTKLFQLKTEVKKAYVKFYRINEDIDRMVKKQIASMSSPKAEGSQEYKVLYEKLFLAEWKKQ